MRTAVYMRVSTEDQAREGFSIPAQREKLLAYVHSQGWEVAAIYAEEGVSAKDTNRPELKRMLKDIREGKTDVVLVYRLDRLTRSVLDLYRLLQEFEKYDVRFKSCTEVYDTTTAIGRLFITLVAALAQWERENLAERVKLGMEQMAKERKRPGGPPPFGYELVDGALTIQHVEAAGVREMFERYEKGESPRQIAEWANRQGLRGKNGASWGASSVLRLLKNPVYHGALRWNYTDGLQRQNSPDQWIVEEAAHPAIIDKDLFMRIQQKMAARSSLHPRVLGSTFCFSGLLYCSLCHSPMRGKTANTKSAGKRYVHRYYVCKNKQAGRCDAPAIREDRLEQAILSELMSYSHEARAALEEVRASLSSVVPFADAEAREQRRALKLRRWEAAYEEGLLTLEAFRLKIAALAKEADALFPDPPPSFARAAFPPYNQLTNWPLLWSHASDEERRMLMTALVKRVEATEAPGRNAHGRTIQLQQLVFL
ncbi:recombinase family protein [Brevibacillus sp. HD3.3A]|uniref:recombinase family protein n=1 Tax=Brevibacillus sp. HD3.3A TaxID=2738979 RepID=UPI00156BC021|nr:recombinase family protein [Brevibacillus sp. HD3.3A]UED67577.1 recombinase family protein [Brevibacillus sp. HD3.3A]